MSLNFCTCKCSIARLNSYTATHEWEREVLTPFYYKTSSPIVVNGWKGQLFSFWGDFQGLIDYVIGERMARRLDEMEIKLNEWKRNEQQILRRYCHVCSSQNSGLANVYSGHSCKTIKNNPRKLIKINLSIHFSESHCSTFSSSIICCPRPLKIDWLISSINQTGLYKYIFYINKYMHWINSWQQQMTKTNNGNHVSRRICEEKNFPLYHVDDRMHRVRWVLTFGWST